MQGLDRQVMKWPPLLVFIATSLDGFIARPDGGIDWLFHQPPTDPPEDHGYDAFVSRVDTLVMGRGSFEKVMTFEQWPYAGLRVIVLSRTLGELPADFRDKAELHRGSLEELRTKVQGSKGVYVDGGQVIQSFLRLGLIDEMTVTRLPVLLGSGLPLFGPLTGDQQSADQWWQHQDTRVFAGSGMVQSTYRRAGTA